LEEIYIRAFRKGAVIALTTHNDLLLPSFTSFSVSTGMEDEPFQIFSSP